MVLNIGFLRIKKWPRNLLLIKHETNVFTYFKTLQHIKSYFRQISWIKSSAIPNHNKVKFERWFRQAYFSTFKNGSIDSIIVFVFISQNIMEPPLTSFKCLIHKECMYSVYTLVVHNSKYFCLESFYTMSLKFMFLSPNYNTWFIWLLGIQRYIYYNYRHN